MDSKTKHAVILYLALTSIQSSAQWVNGKEKHKHRQHKPKVLYADDAQRSISSNTVENSCENPDLVQNTDKSVSQEVMKEPIDEPSDNLRGKQAVNVRGDPNSKRHTEVSRGNRHPTTQTVATEIQDDQAPILEYTNEPLLPLFEACIPLEDILFNLSYYVQLALDETPEVPLDGLTVDESAAIRLYTIEWESPHRSLYSMLNYTLKMRPREELQPYFKYMKLLLTAIVKLQCLSPVTVWRGVHLDLSSDFPPGTLVTWWSFSSCTTELTVLENNMYLGDTGARTLFSVEVINGRTVRNHSHFVTEDEILLLPGTHMEVQSQFSPAADLHIIHLKQVIPTETLLAPPFEGANIFPPEKKKKPWYKKPKSLLEVGVIVALCIAGIIAGAVVGSRRPPPPPICYTRRPTLRADYIWSFDCSDAREDLTGLYNGTLMNETTFVSPDFSGQGKAISLTRDLHNYIALPHSLNLTLNTSFTVSAWTYLTGYSNKPLFTDCSNVTFVCFSVIIKDVVVCLSIYKIEDHSSIQDIDFSIHNHLCQPCWVYFSFTYNRLNQLLAFYFNGILTDSHYLNLTNLPNVKTNKTAIAYIGLDPRGDHEYFNGPMDQFSVSYYAKNTSEILNEATMLCHYDFRGYNISDDSGPNNITARIQDVYRLTENNTNSLLFNSSDSYFQSSGFALIESYTYEYSMAFWLRLILQPSDKENSAIAVLQLSALIGGLSSSLYTCVISFHVNPADGTLGYFFPKLYRVYTLTNVTLRNYTWTHIGFIYNSPDAYSFFVNGQYVQTINDRRFATLISSNSRLSVTIGGAYLNDSISNKPHNYDQMKCFARIPVLNYTQMRGDIDDFMFFARQLSPDGFASLAASQRN